MLSHASATELVGELRRVARDFAQRHRADVALPLAERFGTSLLIAMRPFELAQFTRLRRDGAKPRATERLLELAQDGRARRHPK